MSSNPRWRGNENKRRNRAQHRAGLYTENRSLPRYCLVLLWERGQESGEQDSESSTSSYPIVNTCLSSELQSKNSQITLKLHSSKGEQGPDFGS